MSEFNEMGNLIGIKASDNYYYTDLYTTETVMRIGWYRILKIEKLSRGRYQIDYNSYYETKPELRIILYPSAIQEINYKL